MHVDTITAVVIVVMVIQIWRIKSKFWVHLDSCVNNGTWLSFCKIGITPILSTGPFERLHSKVNQITCPRPNRQENLIFLIIFRPEPEVPTRFSDESVHFCLLIPGKNILFFLVWRGPQLYIVVQIWEAANLVHFRKASVLPLHEYRRDISQVEIPFFCNKQCSTVMTL